jgi:hypothetical protein
MDGLTEKALPVGAFFVCCGHHGLPESSGTANLVLFFDQVFENIIRFMRLRSEGLVPPGAPIEPHSPFLRNWPGAPLH